MAAAPQPEKVTITINGIDLDVPKGEIIVESAKRIGIEIPIFCYHARMKPVGMCRMCLVELGFKQQDGTVRMMPKPQAACTLGADANMVVLTDTQSIRDDRRGVLEFLLINHPLDCPICDRGGECPLQNNTLFYGPSTSRYVEVKRHLPKAFPLSKYVTLDLERCIQCGRCVRFTEEISGDAQLAFLFRGAAMQPQTYELTDFDSKFSGNVIEICPVGALTSSRYRFRARPWDLQTKPAICTECSNGCSTWFDYRVNTMVRINGRTNEAVNEEWTCDRGKFGHDYLNSESRLKRVLLRKGDALVESDWPQAYAEIIERFKNASESAAGIAGGKLSNEDLFIWKNMFYDLFGSRSIDHRWYSSLPSPEEMHDYVTTPIAELENARTIFVFGQSPAETLPIVFLRIRKAWFANGAKVIYVGPRETNEMDAFAQIRVGYGAGQHMRAVSAIKNRDAAALAEMGVNSIAASKLFEALDAPFVTVAARSLLDEANGVEAARALRSIGGEFNLYALEANEQGAAELEILPSDGGMDTWQILDACADRRIKALWLFGCDPFMRCKDRALVTRALENVDYLVVQDILRSEAMEYASVVLPSAAFSERDGSYTNCERRVQYVHQIVQPPGDAKTPWRVFSEIMLRAANVVPPFNAREILALIGKGLPAFDGVDHNTARAEGIMLNKVGRTVSGPSS